jgi:hypothetical protein
LLYLSRQEVLNVIPLLLFSQNTESIVQQSRYEKAKTTKDIHDATKGQHLFF